MQKRQIDRFFKTLSDELDFAVTVILTGAAAGNLMGQVRPSRDIDFEIKSQMKSKGAWEEIDLAVQRTVLKTGIQAQYAEDIDRWGMISLLDYNRHAKLYRQFKG